MNSTPALYGWQARAEKLLTAAPLPATEHDEDEAPTLAYLPVVKVDICISAAHQNRGHRLVTCKGVGDCQGGIARMRALTWFLGIGPMIFRL
jgi:hypothetical protein